MSFLGNVFGGVKNAVTGVGHAVGSALSNPIVKTLGAGALAATGVGAPLAAGIMGGAGLLGGALKPGGGLKPAIGGGVTGALSGYGAGKLGSVLHGAGSVLDKAKGVYGAASGMMGGGGSGGGAAGILGSTLGLGGGAGGGGGGGSTGAISPAVLALAGLQAANAANLGKTANDYSDKAWNLANDSYTSRAGLRSAGINGLQNPKAPDLSGLSAIRAQNPVAARAGVGAPAPSPAPSPMAPSPALPTPLPASLAAADAPAIHGSPSAAPVAQMAPHAPSILRSAILRGLPQAQAPMASARQGFAPQQERGHMLSLNQPFLAA